MGLAPSLEQLEKEKSKKGETRVMTEQQSTPEMIHSTIKDLSSGCSSIRIFGTGGAGKVAAMRFAAQNSLEIPITTIDTSGVANSIPGVETLKIKDLNGSGKLRRDNIEEISNFVADYTMNTTFADVNIVIFSGSGGSGSVLGPLLIDEILRQKKIVVVFCIIDTDSEVDTVNALNCLRTLDNVSGNRKGYIPLFLFNNLFGRQIVDRGIDISLVRLVSILTSPYVGLDKQDRIKFLNPQVFDSVEPGLKLLNIFTPKSQAEIDKGENDEWETDLGLIFPKDQHEKIDATIIIAHIDKHFNLTKRCTVTFRGYYEKDGTDMVAAIGYQIPADFIKTLNSNINAFRSTNTVKRTLIDSEYEIGEASGSKGLIL